MSLRLLTEDDRSWMLPLLERRQYPSTLGVPAELRQQVIVQDYRSHWSTLVTSPAFSAWVGPNQSFWLLQHAQIDSLTGDNQAVLIDHQGQPDDHRLLLEHLRTVCRERQDQAIVVRVYPQSEVPWASLGFRPELARVALHPQRQDEPEGFSLRRAGPLDKMFLTYLNGLATAAYVPAGREGRAAQIAQRNLQTYLGLDLGADSSMVGLILSFEGKDVGYVLLELGKQAEITRQKAAYFYDIVVDPGFHQKGAARALMDHCQNWLVENDWPLLLGDISSTNKIAYHGATRIVGCQLEYERWGLLVQE